MRRLPGTDGSDPDRRVRTTNSASLRVAVRETSPVHVRPGGSSDAWPVAAVHVASWRSTYPGLVPDDYLAGLLVDRRAEAWTRIIGESSLGSRLYVLEDNGLVGFCHYSRSRDDEASDETAELTSIYLVEAAWRRGGGTMLLRAAVSAMARDGYKHATLWVLEGNERARRFYEARDWRPDGAVRVEDRGSFQLHEVRYSRRLPSEVPATN